MRIHRLLALCFMVVSLSLSACTSDGSTGSEDSDGDLEITDGDAMDGDEATDGDNDLDGDAYDDEKPSDGDAADGDMTDGDMTDGDMTDGDVTDGDLTDSDMTDGDMIDGDMIDGDMTDGDATDGDLTDSDMTDGDMTDGDMTDGDMTDGDMTDGDMTDGDMTDGDMTDGDMTDGDMTDGDMTDGDMTDGDMTDGDMTDGDATDGDLTDGDEESTCIGEAPLHAKQDGVCEGTRQLCDGENGWNDDYGSIPNYEADEQSCDGLDNDCDGGEDVGLIGALHAKQDGVCEGTRQRCAGDLGWVDDYDNIPDYEVDETTCDTLDNDCDGSEDEGCPGKSCIEHSECVTGHCQNSFCCAAGDCCGEAGDCPSTYSDGSACDDEAGCQGHREDATCTDSMCGSQNTDDDSDCIGPADTCGFYPTVYCDGTEDQSAPLCAVNCTINGDCDANAHCDGTCLADLGGGADCDEASDCISSHCQNSYCCTAGDCCSDPGDCPAEYFDEPNCDDQASCQGHRKDATCTSNMCASTVVDDDRDCGAGTPADDCGFYLTVYCDGTADQDAPLCPTSCAQDQECDMTAHCDGTCQADLGDGAGCDELSDCDSSHCQNSFCCAAGDCCSVAGDCPATHFDDPVCDVAATCQGHRVDATCNSNICGSTSPVDDDSDCDGETEADSCGYFLPVYCDGTLEQSAPVCATECVIDKDCDENAHCDAPDCLPDVPNVQACNEDSDCVSGYCRQLLCVDPVLVSCVTLPYGTENHLNEDYNDDQHDPENFAQTLDEIICTFSDDIVLTGDPCWQMTPVGNNDPASFNPSYDMHYFPEMTEVGMETITLTAGYDPREFEPACFDGFMRDDVIIEAAVEGIYTLEFSQLQKYPESYVSLPIVYHALPTDSISDITDELADAVNDDSTLNDYVEAQVLTPSLIRIVARDPISVWRLYSSHSAGSGVITNTGSFTHVTRNHDGIQRDAIFLDAKEMVSVQENGDTFELCVEADCVSWTYPNPPPYNPTWTSADEIGDELVTAFQQESPWRYKIDAGYDSSENQIWLIAKRHEYVWGGSDFLSTSPDVEGDLHTVTLGGLDIRGGWQCALLGSETAHQLHFADPSDANGANCMSPLNNAPLEEMVFDFTTDDTLGPRLLDTFPTAGNPGPISVPYATPIVVHFDEAMLSASVEDDIAICWDDYCVTVDDDNTYDFNASWDGSFSELSIVLDSGDLEDNMCDTLGCDIYVSIGYVDDRFFFAEDVGDNNLIIDDVFSPPSRFMFFMEAQ